MCAAGFAAAHDHHTFSPHFPIHECTQIFCKHYSTQILDSEILMLCRIFKGVEALYIMHLSNRLLSSLTLFRSCSNRVRRVKAQKPTERGEWVQPGPTPASSTKFLAQGHPFLSLLILHSQSRSPRTQVQSTYSAPAGLVPPPPSVYEVANTSSVALGYRSEAP